MKKLALFLMLFSLAAVSYAQSVRNPDDAREGKTDFGNIGLQGLDTTGNASYLEFRAADDSSAAVNYTYYVWVDIDSSGNGIIYSASASHMESKASFPTGDWRNIPDGTTSKIGSQ